MITSDLISRQEAIDLLDAVFENAFDTLCNLPTAEKKGMWIVDGEFIDCSACRKEKWSRVPYESLVRRFRYCPKCGARMEGGS